ncbi:hypothetical protein GALMADRAFT_214967 [Galerina marginata CBS 339.88]|uniref:Uncharacterized protein n=1 Tax=Galerina marginata (strain CBS 339.88) TaxID=685588 RepID=A0A067SHR0_GALM3|nr:hypothetical protein GALMADRAFT_214967 [Galerina marginata CBS 339.88]
MGKETGALWWKYNGEREIEINGAQQGLLISHGHMTDKLWAPKTTNKQRINERRQRWKTKKIPIQQETWGQRGRTSKMQGIAYATEESDRIDQTQMQDTTGSSATRKKTSSTALMRTEPGMRNQGYGNVLPNKRKCRRRGKSEMYEGGVGLRGGVGQGKRLVLAQYLKAWS